MTSTDRERIAAMRAQGASYVAIAGALGISVNSVKSYCQRHGLGRAPESAPIQEVALTPITSPPQQEAGACEQCGSPVLRTAGRKQRRFCSDRCRMAWWSAHREQMSQKTLRQFVCGYCGMQFSRYGVAHRSFCSRACASAARRKEAAHDN